MRKVNKELADLQEKFRVFYNENLGEKFAGLETIRVKHLRFFWKWLFIFGFISIAFIYFCVIGVIPSSFFDHDISTWIIFLYLAVVFMVLHEPFADYKAETKNMTMDKILNFFGNFTYHGGRCTPSEDIDKSVLFGYYDKQTGDDFFTGKYKDVKIQVSEERLTRRVKTKNGYRDALVFGGIIIVLEMNKKFLGQTIVRKDWGIFNFLMMAPSCRIGQQSVKMSRVQLEDSVFEKQFEVFSTDQIEARYLLTTAFMERILEVKRRFHGKKIRLSFFGSKLMIAMETSQDMFETTSLFTTTARYGRMREVVSQFYAIFSTIDVLKLNQHLGL